MMTRNEVVLAMNAKPSVFYKVWATPKPSLSDLVEYRFPGVSFTGYFVESRANIMTFLDWLNVERIESW